MKSKIVKAFLLAITLITVLVGIFVCSLNRNKQTIYINEKKSYLSEFNINGDQVQFVCYITVCNEYNTDKAILIKGDFSSEAKNGLVYDEILYATDLNGEKCEYTLKPKEEKSFYVNFIGTFAGTNQMTSRQLPPILIEVLQ